MADQHHILVVEDEQHLATGIKYNLDAEGYRVTTVGDGPSALKLIDEDPDGVDLIVLDLMLPGMSGYAVCEALRAAERDLPILILSARTLSEDLARGFDVGANQYMTKPFDLDEFLSRVKNLLKWRHQLEEQHSAAAEEVKSYEFGNARINFETFEVTIADEPVRMTRLEMTLLQYFVTNEGRVIPRSELLENVWGMPGHMHTRAPDQFIRRLRKTFEPNPADPCHFLTIRDAGYRFIAKPEES